MISENGLSEGVLNELERALEDHELIKIKIAISDREARKSILQELIEKCNAERVQEIGKTGLIYRTSSKKGIKTSNVR
jgi:RNA-binding protein